VDIPGPQSSNILEMALYDRSALRKHRVKRPRPHRETQPTLKPDQKCHNDMLKKLFDQRRTMSVSVLHRAATLAA
jgi:hypothetical protein